MAVTSPKLNLLECGCRVNPASYHWRDWKQRDGYLLNGGGEVGSLRLKSCGSKLFHDGKPFGLFEGLDSPACAGAEYAVGSEISASHRL